ncbi:MAG TPA: CoA-binding protein [Acidimicrobiales bacterium]|nr:CoA-binding protein [Acidimicrobiales bacterium]
MPSLDVVHDFLDQDHLAFVGVSREPKAFANSVYRRLRQDGRVLYPVNRSPEAATVEGDTAFRALADVPDPVGGVVVMVPRAAQADVVREALERGIPRVWLHRGAGQGPVSEEAVALCREAGVAVVDGACPLMFTEPVKGIHRMHRGLIRRRFAA